MLITRRDILRAGASVAALAALPRPLLAQLGGAPEPVPAIEDPRLKSLALRALEAARAAGASYADVRLSHTRTRTFSESIAGVHDSESMVVGVRTLVDGYWGFASSPVWSPDELARLGREAVHQAKVNTVGQARSVELAPVPVIADGHWTMPVELDPFEISPFEIVDYLMSLRNFVGRYPGFGVVDNQSHFQVQEKAFASSEGSYCTQRLYRSEGGFSIKLERAGTPKMGGSLDRLTPAGVGWELYKGQPLRDYIVQLMAEIEEDAKLPFKPVEVGRYDTVCDASSVAQLVDQTFGRATELDRARGFEANASGTSYLNDPLAMLDSYEAGAAAITLTAERSQRGGAATTKWDDEGVEPDDLTLVKSGVLRDFQTTREGAGWLGASYAKRGSPVRSHGCAAAPSALEAPLTHTPNLTLTPGGKKLDFDAAIANVGKGIAVRGMGVDMDFQSSSGLATGSVYEVKGGKRVAHLNGAGFLFRSTELWKGLKAVGGAESLRRYGQLASKGEPAQRTYHSVTAPPAVFEQLTLIDVMRKA
ncbi:MAG TPA: metallopeptidase TldD-related protein [Gemmatimonadaceae bacterium]